MRFEVTYQIGHERHKLLVEAANYIKARHEAARQLKARGLRAKVKGVQPVVLLEGDE